MLWTKNPNRELKSSLLFRYPAPSARFAHDQVGSLWQGTEFSSSMCQASSPKCKLCQSLPLPVKKLTEKMMPLLRVQHIKGHMLLANFNESHAKFFWRWLLCAHLQYLHFTPNIMLFWQTWQIWDNQDFVENLNRDKRGKIMLTHA